MKTEEKNLQEIIQFRLEKLEKIKNAGINPYAYNFNKKDAIESLTKKGESGVGEKVITAGRMVSFRKMGKASRDFDFRRVTLYILFVKKKGPDLL